MVNMVTLIQRECCFEMCCVWAGGGGGQLFAIIFIHSYVHQGLPVIGMREDCRAPRVTFTLCVQPGVQGWLQPHILFFTN